MPTPEATVIKPIVQVKDNAGPLDMFIVVAWWVGGHWRVFPDKFLDEATARTFAEGLACGWTRRRIFRLTDPGA